MKDRQVIVSLTSFPAAIEYASQAARSVLRGSVKPDKVVLYLTAAQFPDGVIPAELTALMAENQLFEVRWCEEVIRSYTKLIPALRDFPEAIIVTIDDDVIYPRGLLAKLLRRHRKYPNAIVGHRVRRIENGKRYLDWKIYKNLRYFTWPLRPSFRNMQTGVGSVLYPPHSLDEHMLDPKVFMAVAPTVDDMWFWAAAVAAGTKITPVPFGNWRQKRLEKPAAMTLRKDNILSGKDVNREVFEVVMEMYPEIKRRFGE